MKAVVTGAAGFIGKNLVVALRRAQLDVAEIDIDSPSDVLAAGVRGAQVVFHLAGVNRPQNERQFVHGNVGSLDVLLAAIDQLGQDRKAARPLVVLSSSTQASSDNPYGRSKLAAEQTLAAYADRTGASA